MLELKNLKLTLLLSLLAGFILTRLFPFLFGHQIYSDHGWRFLAPSSLVLGPGSRVSLIDRFMSIFFDAVVFGLIVFVLLYSLRSVIRHSRSIRQ